MRAIAATIHGSEELGDAAAVAAFPALGAEVTDLPQLWQNLAPGLSTDPHPEHGADSRDAPQFEQNFPEPGCEQDAQTTSICGG